MPVVQKRRQRQTQRLRGEKKATHTSQNTDVGGDVGEVGAKAEKNEKHSI